MNPKSNKCQPLRVCAFLLFFVAGLHQLDASAAPAQVKLDFTEVPHLKQWGKDVQAVLVEWHPRISNLLASKGFDPPTELSVRIRDTEQGIGATQGTRITLSSHWIEKHPDDVGMVVHELVHVVQGYPPGSSHWLTEGIADYIRWAIYEGKDLEWFPRPNEEQGYRKGYRVAAGFLLWLESELSPGVVKKLKTALRRGDYTPELFSRETGMPLDELWQIYLSDINGTAEPRP